MISHPKKMLVSKRFYICFSSNESKNCLSSLLENYKLSLERQFTTGHLIVLSFFIKLIQDMVGMESENVF